VIFQAIDDNKSCVGVYSDGELIFDELPENLTKTWKYAAYLDDMNVEYAYIYAKGQQLHEVCPEYMLDNWKRVKKKFEAYLKTFQIAKVSLYDNCLYDLVPHGFLKEFFDVRNNITKHVFENYDKPDNYDFLSETYKTVYDIKHQQLNIDYNSIQKSSLSHAMKGYLHNLKKYEKRCSYNIFGTKTGRFTNTSDSFPILTMPKALRGIIRPQNDWLLALDYNGAEVRTLLSLLGEEQPEHDIHEWNAKNIFDKTLDRDEAKKRFFAWLYNPKSDDVDPKFYNRDEIIEKYWEDGELRTAYGRQIKVDKEKALNYCLQSTCADTISDRMNVIHNFLKDKKSKIAFSVHDEIVIDMAKEDKVLIPEIIELFSNNKLGKFSTTVKAGKNFGDLRKLNL
jgi:hypothetical protein